MINYEKHLASSNQEWVIFIHGLGGSIKTWKYQMEAFKDYNKICVDLEGHGKSRFESEGNIETVSANEIKDIMDKEGIDKAHIVALSLGTIVAMEFTYLYPDMVSSITLAGCVLNLSVPKKGLILLAKIMNRIVPFHTSYKIFANIIMPKRNQKLSRDIFIREAKKMTTKSFRAWVHLLLIGQAKLKSYINRINEHCIPILFATGKEDYLFLPGIKKLKDKFTNCQNILFEKCGHVCSIDKKEQFNESVLIFLNNVKDEYVEMSA